MIDYSLIRSVHLEISTRCNAACPLCPRNSSGYDADLSYPIHDMTLEEAKKIFPVGFLKQLYTILINGNFGDFVTAKDGLAIVQYFAQSNPRIRIEISTNGGAKPKIWEELAKIPNLTIGFGIDGLADTHSLYRRNTDWNTVIDNAKKFIDAGGRATWRMIKFKHNEHQVEECRALSVELGFKQFSISYDGRDSGPVYDRYGNFESTIGDTSYMKEFPPRIETWDLWSLPGCSPKGREEQYKTIPIKSTVNCHSMKYKEIYVTATGEVYPCCWLGMYPKLDYAHPWQEDNHQIKAIVKNNNALEVGIKKSIEWFNEIEESWNKKAYSEGRLFKCDNNCGR